MGGRSSRTVVVAAEVVRTRCKEALAATIRADRVVVAVVAVVAVLPRVAEQERSARPPLKTVATKPVTVQVVVPVASA
jgi:hypothetical protein